MTDLTSIFVEWAGSPQQACSSNMMILQYTVVAIACQHGTWWVVFNPANLYHQYCMICLADGGFFFLAAAREKGRQKYEHNFQICMLHIPAEKQKYIFSLNEKWTLPGFCIDFTIMSTVAKVTARAPPNVVHVGRSSQGPLLMTTRKSLRGPCEVHFFFFQFSKI